MPIEIRELIVRTTLQDEQTQAKGGASQGGDADNDRIIAECVNQVMQLIKEQIER